MERRLAPLPLIAGGAALVFGGLTLFFHDPRFLKIKPTVMNTALRRCCCWAAWRCGKNPLKLLLGDAFDLPDAVWRTLTLRYARASSWRWRRSTRSSGAPRRDATWVLFRFPGLMILTVIFSLRPGAAPDEVHEDRRAAAAAAE